MLSHFVFEHQITKPKPLSIMATKIIWVLLLGTVFSVLDCQANVEVTFSTPGVANTNGSPNSSNVTVKTRTSIEIAVYVISCLAVFFFTVCCFYCCKHFCCDGCRGGAIVTYQQMGPTPFNTGSIRIPIQEPVIATSPKLTLEAPVDMIPLRGMKKVSFSSKVTRTTAPTTANGAVSSPPPYYENFP